VTPRGLWNGSGRAAFTTLEHWLDARVATDLSPDTMLLRYLAAYGPSTVADAQAWCGVRPLGAAFERLRPRLRVVRDEGDRDLFDVPRAPLVDPRTPAPVRFLPEYDNVLLGHKDRTRIVPRGIKPWTEVGWGGVLVDGMFAGRWRLFEEGERPVLRVEPFEPPTARARREIAAEGRLLGELLAPDAATVVDLARA
jgi:winged helix DNA-binding protein